MQVGEELPSVGRAAIGIGQNNQDRALAKTGHLRVANIKECAATHCDAHGLKWTASEHRSECFEGHAKYYIEPGGKEVLTAPSYLRR